MSKLVQQEIIEANVASTIARTYNKLQEWLGSDKRIFNEEEELKTVEEDLPEEAYQVVSGDVL